MNIDDSLPFEPKQQDALLGHILSERNFFLQVKDRVKGNWFIDGFCGRTYTAYCKFYEQFSRTPASDAEFMASQDVQTLPKIEMERVRATVIRCRNEAMNYGTDLLMDSLTGWLQSKIFIKYFEEGSRLYNSRQFEKAKSMITTFAKELQEIHFDGKKPADFTNPRALVEHQTKECGDAMTLGHQLLDQKMNPDCPPGGGSLLRGDSTVVLAPTNIGKTTFMISVAVHNIVAGKDVLLVFHEGRESDLMEKIWCCFLNVTKATFRSLVLSNKQEHRDQVEAFSKQLNERLVMLHMQRPGLTVEEVIGAVRIQQQRRKAAFGKGFDLFVDDYPAILTTEQARGVRMDRRNKDALVYRYLVDLAGEEMFHGLFAAQTNREGSKMNKKIGEYRNKNSLLTLEYVQESYEITNSATNLLTLNRSPDDERNNIITIFFGKSRSSETNWAVSCRSAYAHSRTHSPRMQATAFRGTEAFDQLDSALVDYNGKEADVNRYAAAKKELKQ